MTVGFIAVVLIVVVYDDEADSFEKRCDGVWARPTGENNAAFSSTKHDDDGVADDDAGDIVLIATDSDDIIAKNLLLLGRSIP
jgi:hypothetical protein